MSLLQKRSAIIELFVNGASQAKIFKELGSANYNRSLISRTINRYKQTGSIAEKPRSGRPRSIRNYTTIRKVKQMLARKPTLSHRKVAARAKISRGSACRIISRDLGLRSYKRSKTEALTLQTIGKRVTRCRRLLDWLKNVNPDTILFTDEKIWSVQEKYNCQNSRVYSNDRAGIPDVYKSVEQSLHPKSVMIWAGISGCGRTKLVFIPQGTKITANVYQNLILEKHVKKITTTFMKGKNWTFQQDGAPTHTAKSSLEWLANNVPNFLGRDQWPPSSPDLNPCDYYLWGRMEQKVNNRAHDTIESLKRALIRAWGELDQNEVTRACNSFEDRVRATIKAKGKRFEIN